jgi:carbamate kinase
MVRKIILAVGGNSLLKKLSDKEKNKSIVQDLQFQINNLGKTTDQIVKAINECNLTSSFKSFNLIVTTGNGPQVGILMQRSELSKHSSKEGGLGYEIEMDICGADTQGAIGHMFYVAYNNSIVKLNLAKQKLPSLISMLTPVEVDRSDEAFIKPTKFVGLGYDTREEADKAMKRESWDGYAFYPQTEKWRRLVASPAPVKIESLEAIETLYNASKFLLVCGVGGGVPYSIKKDKTIRREAAVIDKDLETAVVAVHLGIEEFFISTAVDYLKLDFKKPTERNVVSLSAKDLDKFLDEDKQRKDNDKQFALGAMEPKLRAIKYFLDHSKVKDAKAYIVSVNNIKDAIVDAKNCTVIGKDVETVIEPVMK